jgi:hypothetical protein
LEIDTPDPAWFCFQPKEYTQYGLEGANLRNLRIIALPFNLRYYWADCKPITERRILTMSNTHKIILTLLCLISVSLACNNEFTLSDKPQIPPTRTPLPTFTPAPVVEVTIVIPPTPTETPIPTLTFTPESTNTPEPTPTELPTETPVVEETPTEEPIPTQEPTNTPQPVQEESEPVRVEEPAQAESAEEAAPAAPGVGAHGVIGKITFRDGRNTYGVGEQVFVHIEATNTTDNMIPFGILGLATSTGQFQSSWTEDAIAAGGVFNHEDGVGFPTPGNHKLWLSVCFSTKDVCQSPDGDWERFEPGLDVVIQ